MTGAPIDLLYRLTQRDQAFPHWGPVMREFSREAALGTLETAVSNFDYGLPPPAGTLLFVTRVVIEVNIPLTITLLSIELLSKFRVAGLREVLLYGETESPPIAGGTRWFYNMNMDVALLMDRRYLAARAVFSGPNAANKVTVFYSGYATAQGEIGFN